MTKDFLIIGGGLSGLLFAYRLNKSKKNGVVLEASANFGGALSHTYLKNFKVDSGAESFSLVNDSTLQLVRDLGIENHLVFPENLPAYLKFESDFKPIPNGLLGIPGDLSASDLTEIFSDDEISTAKNLDQQSWQISENVTLGELVESRYGQVFVDKLLTPIVMGVYANSPYELESEAVIPELVKKSKYFQSLEQGVNALRATNNRPGANVASLKDGMNFLIDTLINQIDQKRFNLLPNKRVTAIEKSKDFWNVVTHDGEAFQAKNLIICCPLNIAASFFNEVQISNELKKFNTQSVTIVLALVNSIKLNNTPIGTGALKAYDLTGNSAKATTHVSAKWQWIKDSLPPNHHIVRFSFGYQGLTVSQTIGKVEIASALKNFYKIELDEFEIIDFKQIYWPNGLSQLSSGHRENLSALEGLEHIFPGLIFAGSGASGSGITALVKKASLRIEKLLL